MPTSRSPPRFATKLQRLVWVLAHRVVMVAMVKLGVVVVMLPQVEGL